MRSGILFISTLGGMLSILSIFAGAELSYVNVQNTTNANTTGVNMTNATSDGNVTGGNATASNTQTSPALEGGYKTGIIAEAPKCLGSALCPD